MKIEFNWVKDIKVTDIVEITPNDPKKSFKQRKILINTGNEFYTLILNGSYTSNLQMQINVDDPDMDQQQTKQKTKPKKKTSKS